MTNDTRTSAWKPIPEFPLYEVSDSGSIRNSKTGRLRRTFRDRDGYERVALRRGGLGLNRAVHRLVLEAFHGPCPEGMEGCHTDGDKTNNSSSNLRWDTHRKNIDDLVTSGILRGPRSTHCPQGHELGGANMRSGSTRACLACNRARGYAQSVGVPFTKRLADSYYERLIDL